MKKWMVTLRNSDDHQESEMKTVKTRERESQVGLALVFLIAPPTVR